MPHVLTTAPGPIVRSSSHLWFHPHLAELEGEREWQSRQHRKGKPLSHEPRRRKWFSLHWWDASWWTAFWFLLGSVAWVANGAVAFHAQPSTPGGREQQFDWLQGTAFVGGTFFYFGGWTMYWEALNEEEHAEFDVAVRRAEKNVALEVLDLLLCRSLRKEPHERRRSTWRWIGCKSWRDMSFAANFTQYLGTSVFWISTIAILFLPLDEAEKQGAYYAAFWAPQVVGAGFLTLSSVLLTLENQHRWWKPRPLSIGWEVGAWNVGGSVGFFLSGLFGFIFTPEQETARRWGVAFSTYLGSYFFLIGSAFQYYETLT